MQLAPLDPPAPTADESQTQDVEDERPRAPMRLEPVVLPALATELPLDDFGAIFDEVPAPAPPAPAASASPAAPDRPRLQAPSATSGQVSSASPVQAAAAPSGEDTGAKKMAQRPRLMVTRKATARAAEAAAAAATPVAAEAAETVNAPKPAAQQQEVTPVAPEATAASASPAGLSKTPGSPAAAAPAQSGLPGRPGHDVIIRQMLLGRPPTMPPSLPPSVGALVRSLLEQANAMEAAAASELLCYALCTVTACNFVARRLGQRPFALTLEGLRALRGRCGFDAREQDPADAFGKLIRGSWYAGQCQILPISNDVEAGTLGLQAGTRPCRFILAQVAIGKQLPPTLKHGDRVWRRVLSFSFSGKIIGRGSRQHAMHGHHHPVSPARPKHLGLFECLPEGEHGEDIEGDEEGQDRSGDGDKDDKDKDGTWEDEDGPADDAGEDEEEGAPDHRRDVPRWSFGRVRAFVKALKNKWRFVATTRMGRRQDVYAFIKTAPRAGVVEPYEVMPVGVQCQCGSFRRLAPELQKQCTFPVAPVQVLDMHARRNVRWCKCTFEDAESKEVAQPETVRDDRDWNLRRELASGEVLPIAPVGTLAGRDALGWTIFQGRPPHVPATAWAEIGPPSRAVHRNRLREVQAWALQYPDRSLAHIVLNGVLTRARLRNLRWSTVSSYLSAYRSAIASLPMYSFEKTGYDLGADRVFRAACARARHNAKTATPPGDTHKTKPLEMKDAFRIYKACKRLPVWTLFGLCLAFAARVGDMFSLRTADIHMPAKPGGTMTITLKGGKGGACVGPKTYHAVVDESVVKDLALLLAERAAAGKDYVWEEVDRHDLSKVMHSFGYVLHSIRVGALIAWAQLGVSEEDLRRMAGHHRMTTTHHYVGDGRFLLNNKDKAAARGELALALATYRGGGPGWEGTAPGWSPSEDEDAGWEWVREDEETSDERTVDRALAELDSESLAFADVDDLVNSADEHAAQTATAEVAAQGVVQPPVMGAFSGHHGVKGKRVQRSTEEAHAAGMSLHGVSHKALGTEHLIAVPFGDMVLHLKPVTILHLLNFGVIASEVGFGQEWGKESGWLGDEQRYRALAAAIGRRGGQIPKAKFTAAQIADMIAYGKISPYDAGDDVEDALILFVKMFLVPEYLKGRFRIIAEAIVNQVIGPEDLTRLRYPQRLERRRLAHGHRLVALFDFAAQFDAIPLGDAVKRFFVVRTDPFNGHTLWTLNALPMGARFSPLIAQIVTWSLCRVIRAECPEVTTTTMVDNIRLSSSNEKQFVAAIRLLHRLVEHVNLTLNDPEEWNLEADEAIVAKGAETAKGYVFLGEEHLENGTLMRNKASTVEKLRMAAARFNDPNEVKTVRNAASLISLCAFLAHTLGMSMRDHYDVMRHYSRLHEHGGAWDDVYVGSASSAAAINGLVARLLPNVPVPVAPMRRPSTRTDDYDIIVIIDACELAWGAYVYRLTDKGSNAWMVVRSFERRHKHSAHAEPLAVCDLVAQLAGFLPKGLRAAIVTDHMALVTGQCRWYSGFGGCSASRYLNEAFRRGYSFFGTLEFFHVEGAKNPADGPSRSYEAARARKPVWSKLQSSMVPSLTSFEHPFLSHEHLVDY